MLAWVEAPLVVHGRLFGFVAADNRRSARRPTRDELQNLRLLATLAAQFFENAEKQRDRERIAHSLIHYLEAPFGVMSGALAQLLSDRRFSDEERQDLLSFLDVERERFVRNRQKLSKLFPRVPPALSPVSIAAIIQEVKKTSVMIMRASPKLRARELTIEVNAPFDADCGVLGDADDLYLAVFNLVENALLASPPGEVVEVILTRENGQCTVVVLDRGPGLPPKIAANPFLQFQRQGYESTPTHEGLGLGLWSSRLIARSYDGGLEYCCRKDRSGACFRLYFPSA